MSAEFVWRMEDVLDLYAEPFDENRPQVCFDERPCQLISDKHEPLAGEPGKPKRIDYEYKREGTCNIFVIFQPLAGWRKVKVTEQRRKQDFAQSMKELVDEHFPQAQLIRVVLDNLNTHSPASLYEAFEPQEARRISRKLEFHYTPKHGSWLNMAEVEIAVLSSQCLNRRIGNTETLEREINAWEQARNQHRATVEWQFSTADARVKLKRLYPS